MAPYTCSLKTDNLEHAWLICVKCAQRMDRNPAFREAARPAFEEYQRRLREYVRRDAGYPPLLQ
jgi:hypothetical protein